MPSRQLWTEFMCRSKPENWTERRRTFIPLCYDGNQSLHFVLLDSRFLNIIYQPYLIV